MLETSSMESSVLLTLKGLGKERMTEEERKTSDSVRTTIEDNLWCSYYKKPRHAVDKCWKLHGKPAKGGQSKGHALVASNQQSEEEKALKQPDSMGLNQEEIEKLRNLLGSLEKVPGTSTSNLAFIGITSNSFNFHASNLSHRKTWILDSSATHHMTFVSTKFLSHKPYPSTIKIVLVDGSLTTMNGQGDIFINPYLTLRDILHVPKLFTNLISIQKLTKDTNCRVIFYPLFYEFQEKDSRKMIGCDRVEDGRYHLEDYSGQLERGKFSPISF